MSEIVQLKAFDIQEVASQPKTQSDSWIKKALEKRSTYQRKYYLHRRVKLAGYSLTLERCEKTINVKPQQTEKAKEDKYISELQKSFGYGVQIINA